MLNYPDREPMKWDFKENLWQSKGNIQGYTISAGLNWQAVIQGYENERPYKWVESDQTWRDMGGDRLRLVALSKANKIVKVDYAGDQVFRQVNGPGIESCLKKARPTKCSKRIIILKKANRELKIANQKINEAYEQLQADYEKKSKAKDSSKQLKMRIRKLSKDNKQLKLRSQKVSQAYKQLEISEQKITEVNKQLREESEKITEANL